VSRAATVLPTADPGLVRLVDGLLMPGFTGPSVPDWLADAVTGGLGAVCWFAGNVTGAQQAAGLSAALHELGPSLLVASDEEGGDVTRLEAGRGSRFPSAAALGRVDDVEATERLAGQLGRLVRSLGVDLALAPSVDVNADPDNPVIGTRSFSADPSVVARHGAAVVRGLQGAGVAACAKHFPGHGSVDVDSHTDLPVLDADLATLEARELPPFDAALRAGVRTVMTGHLVVPALDPDAPATCSPAALTLLRSRGFDGVVISDALDMAAVAAPAGLGAAAVRALAAGVDLLCIGNPGNASAAGDGRPGEDLRQFTEVRTALLAAVEAGALPVDRLEDAARRVGELARWCRDQRSRLDLPGDADDDLDDEVPADSAALSAAALDVVGDVRLSGVPHVVDLRTRSNVAAGRTAPRLLAALRRTAPGTTASTPPTAGTAGERVAASLPGPGRASVVALASEPHRDPAQAALLAALLAAVPDAVVVQTGWPDPRARLGARSVTTWGAGRAAAEAAAAVLLAPA
jgi:beta-N-acetylhexosaminidase